MATAIETMNKVNVKTVCPMCGKETILTVNKSDYEAWTNGTLVQDAFPYLNADEREMLITGICEKCWKMMFN